MKTATIKIRCTEDQKTRWEEAAAEVGRSLSSWMCMAADHVAPPSTHRWVADLRKANDGVTILPIKDLNAEP